MEATRKAKAGKGTKRSRSATPSKGSGSPPKKKSKKSKKNKSTGDEASTPSKSKPTKSSLDETATADGKMMAQMLSTFSLMEQSRFEAFKRATLPAKAVQNWIAACLVHRLTPASELSSSQLQPNNPSGRPTSLETNNSTTTSSPLLRQQRPLSDLVVPESHDEIGMVVATAAKIYAQRLVAAAVQVKAQQQQQTAATANTTAALQPEHVWQALQERQQSGIDPGFYMQANERRYQWNATSNHATAAEHSQLRLAALEAQEAYEKVYGSGNSNVAAANGDDVAGKNNSKEEGDDKKRSAMDGVVTTS